MSLGENIRHRRRDRGWTQGELSEKSGVKLGHISKLERNETDPKLSTLYKLMQALECSADSLLMDTKQMSLSAQLRASYERAEALSDHEKEIILDLIDKYCVASGLQGLMSSGKKMLAF